MAITLGAALLGAAGWWVTSAALAFADASVLDPLLPVGAGFIVLRPTEHLLGKWGPPRS